MPDRFTSTKEGAPQIHANDSIEVGSFDLVTCARHLNTCIVDQDVEGTERFDRLAKNLLDLRFVSNVTAYDDRTRLGSRHLSRGAFYFLLDYFSVLRIREVVNGYVSALLAEADGDSLSNPR